MKFYDKHKVKFASCKSKLTRIRVVAPINFQESLTCDQHVKRFFPSIRFNKSITDKVVNCKDNLISEKTQDKLKYLVRKVRSNSQ